MKNPAFFHKFNSTIKMPFAIYIVYIALFFISACKNDTGSIQETLKKNFLGTSNKSTSATSPGSKISPTKEDKKTLENSIKSCPEESKLLGRAFPQGKRQFCAYKDDNGEIVKHGEYRQWFSTGGAASGTIQIQAFYEDDELNGEFIEYYPSGQIKEKTNYAHGKKEGESTIFNKDGSKFRIANYSNDFLHGQFTEFLQEEKPKIKCNYHMDQKNGPFEEYDKKGILISKIEYRQDKKHGRVNLFNQKGIITAKGFYENDLQMGHWVYFDNEGIKKSEGNLVNGEKHGRWIDYDNQGAPRRTTYYNRGKKLDSVLHKNQTQAVEGGGRGFGSRDILGSEPIPKRNKPLVIPPKKKEKPAPLTQDGWAPL